MEKEADASAAQEILDGLNVDVNRLLPVPEKAFEKAWIQGNDTYLQMYRESIENTSEFWNKVREERKRARKEGGSGGRGVGGLGKSPVARRNE